MKKIRKTATLPDGSQRSYVDLTPERKPITCSYVEVPTEPRKPITVSYRLRKIRFEQKVIKVEITDRNGTHVVEMSVPVEIKEADQ